MNFPLKDIPPQDKPLGKNDDPDKPTKAPLIKKDLLVKQWSYDISNSYMVEKKLGQGSYGQVFLVTHKQLKIQRALKVVNKTVRPKSQSNPEDELNLLKQLDHPNILRIYEYYSDSDKWYIITEYFEGRELFEEIIGSHHLSQASSVEIIVQIIKALVYIHKNGIAHRDIKAENVLVRKEGEEYVVKIIDWGLASLASGSKFSRKCGTPEYCAPEVVSGQYTFSCDLWSLGVLVYIMLSGYMPFKGKNTKETLLIAKKGHANFNLPVWESVSLEAKKFVNHLLEKRPEDRLTAEEALSHTWVVQGRQNSSEKETEKTLEKTLIRLRETHSETRFRTVVIDFITNFIKAPIQQQRLRKQFEKLDLNGDGTISHSELLYAYRKIYGPEADLIVDQIFKDMDLDGSGSISYSEYVTFATEQNQAFTQEQLRAAFKLFDSDEDGAINKREIYDIICYGVGSAEELGQLDQILQEIDLNNDGTIDFEEFVLHINKAIKTIKKKSSEGQKMPHCDSKTLHNHPQKKEGGGRSQ